MWPCWEMINGYPLNMTGHNVLVNQLNSDCSNQLNSDCSNYINIIVTHSTNTIKLQTVQNFFM